ncbi:MAG: hypothetical protein ACTSP3_13550 [Candidatus Heimdallarchaeaceae archaeon]
MKDEKKKIKDNSRYPKGFSEEYRSVRFYSNINGIEKEYGYDYKRDADGKEEFREIGEIPKEFGESFVERLSKLERSFDWDRDFFTSSFESLANLLPSFSQLMGEFARPSLLSGEREKRKVSQERDDTIYDAAYDLQLNKDKKELYLIVELPGFSKEDINLKLVKKKLRLSGNNGKREINVEIPIDYEVDTNKKIAATMRNGILEVKLHLLETENGDGTEIPIN